MRNENRKRCAYPASVFSTRSSIRDFDAFHIFDKASESQIVCDMPVLS